MQLKDIFLNLDTRLADIKKHKDEVARLITAHKRLSTAHQSMTKNADPTRNAQLLNEFRNAKQYFETTEKDVTSMLRRFEVSKSDHVIVWRSDDNRDASCCSSTGPTSRCFIMRSVSRTWARCSPG